MSRLVSLLIVLLAIAVATPVLAEQRLTLSGEMRVRGYSIIAPNYEKTSADSQQYFDSRFRLIGRIAVAEGVSVHFLNDMSGTTTGNQWPNQVQQAGTRAWMNVDVGMVNMLVGKFQYALGNNIVYDQVQTGAVFTLKGAVPVQFAYFKHSDADRTMDDDIDTYTLNVAHSTDMYRANVFGGLLRNGAADVTKIYLVGTQANFNLDPINVNFELNYFTGDNGASGAAKQDFKGLQAFVDVGAAVADNVTVGARAYYARGYSDKADTTQTRAFADASGNWVPESYGSMATLFSTFDVAGNSAIFDPSGQGAGVLAIQPYATMKIMDPLTASVTAGYARPEEKNLPGAGNRVDLKSVYWANVSGTYTLATRTNLDGVVSYAKPSFRSNRDDDARIVAGMRLRVNF